MLRAAFRRFFDLDTYDALHANENSDSPPPNLVDVDKFRSRIQLLKKRALSKKRKLSSTASGDSANSANSVQSPEFFTPRGSVSDRFNLPSQSDLESGESVPVKQPLGIRPEDEEGLPEYPADTDEVFATAPPLEKLVPKPWQRKFTIPRPRFVSPKSRKQPHSTPQGPSQAPTRVEPVPQEPIPQNPSFGMAGRPQPVIYSSLNIEMPKYTLPLSRTALYAFIIRFQRWCQAKKISEDDAKLIFPQAFTNVHACNYFTINQADQIDASITWNDFIHKFITNCPFEAEDPKSVLEILQQKQLPLEKASIFIQRLRAQIVEDYSKYDEKDLIRLLTKNLNSHLQNFLECRGPPETYNDLMTLVKRYEERGLDKVVPYSPTAVPASSSSAFTPHLDAASALHKLQSDALAKASPTQLGIQMLHAEDAPDVDALATQLAEHLVPILEVRLGTRRQGQRGRDAESKYCRYHKIRTHNTSECRQLKRIREAKQKQETYDHDEQDEESEPERRSPQPKSRSNFKPRKSNYDPGNAKRRGD